MAETTFETVKKVLVDGLSVDESAVTPEASLTEDLGADSLDAVEMIMSLEEELGIEIPTEKAESVKTVQDMVDLVDSIKK
ncbi:MAG: acyl carrier protein [Coriobacteriales bacterium]|jgi:acyl carrier protein|nr:acyl carrier protein [Coriobacteriales bacterium]